MRVLFWIIFFFQFNSLFAQQPLPPVGLWREHLPYGSAIDVAGSATRIYCATPYSLFTYNIADRSFERMSKVTGLSETGISSICYDALNEKLFIAYANSNIDIIHRNDIINVPDIKQDNIIGNKKIYAVYARGTDYYLSTGLGVIVVDGERYEIKDSWFIGNGGNRVQVNGFTSDGSFFYAATEEGLKKTRENTTNPANYANWQVMGLQEGLSPGPVQNVLKLQNKIIVQKNDSLFVQNGTNWTFFFYNDWPIINSNVAEDRIILCQRKNTGEAKLTVLRADGITDRSFVQPGIISFPRKAILIDNMVWLADQFGGLSHFTGTSFEQFKPNSPEATASGEMTVFNNVFYATAGEINEAWNYQYNGNGIYVLKEGQWTNINRYRFAQLDTLLDYIAIAIDKRDQTIWAGSYGGGLLHVKTDQSFQIYKQGELGAAVGDPGSYRVSGLAFDANNNLWVSNYGATQPLLVKKNDDTWIRFTTPFFLSENSLAQILIDENNYKWIVGAKGNGLICFDSGESLENTNDDRWKKYAIGTGLGNLPDNNVLCIAKDRNGFIWVGTSNGIGVIQCAQDAFGSMGCDAIWPIVQQGNFAGYLFSGQEIRSIAVDGADRKWVATANGVSLISADGQRVIYQFTEANSPLLSNDVKKITIDGKTGEVFFATLNGICSFRSTATEATDKHENVLVFPNPVPPGFSGTIAIRGLADNSIVKITEPDGRLVYQTRALGGQAVWDGKDYRGRKISTGVYLVIVSTDPATAFKVEKTVSKIVFISK